MSTDDLEWMQMALQQARYAARQGEVPVGAVVVHKGVCIGSGMNLTITEHDPCAHAEIIALREAGRALQNYRLNGATVYVTLEPCPMCVGAMLHARIARLVFAAADPKTGAVDSVFGLLRHPHHNHSIICENGLLEDQASELLRDFFRRQRDK